MDYLLTLIKNKWHKFPELRFMQLLLNLQHTGERNMYEVEDNALIERLNDMYGR